MLIDVVIPTIGRPSLATLLAALGAAAGPRPAHIILADDRADPAAPLGLGALDADLRARIVHVASHGRGPAAARNAGWRASRAEWVAFLDDDVVVDAAWLAALHADLRDLEPPAAASYGRVRVPLPTGRKPTDWERDVAGLETAAWITADCAVRRSVLLAVGGFDERFPRAFREDADLALRILARGERLMRGTRGVTHPVRPAPWWISIARQSGNADDVLMAALHGRGWRRTARAPRGALPEHVVAVVALTGGAAAAFAGRSALARALVGVWLLQTARFAWRRIAPGPRTRAESAAMVATSIAIPWCAVAHRLVATAGRRALLADRRRAPRPVAPAVLFDRDGTLIADVPYNADPARVVPMPAARAALDRLRAAGLRTAVVSNQSGVGLGLLRSADVAAINARMEELLGPLGPIVVCPHAPAAGCDCRKPRAGLIRAAASALGVAASDCVVIGDIGADVEAAAAAGARAVLVPTSVTRRQEVDAAPLVARDLDEAVSAVVSGRV